MRITLLITTIHNKLTISKTITMIFNYNIVKVKPENYYIIEFLQNHDTLCIFWQKSCRYKQIKNLIIYSYSYLKSNDCINVLQTHRVFGKYFEYVENIQGSCSITLI